MTGKQIEFTVTAQAFILQICTDQHRSEHFYLNPTGTMFLLLRCIALHCRRSKALLAAGLCALQVRVHTISTHPGRLRRTRIPDGDGTSRWTVPVRRRELSNGSDCSAPVVALPSFQTCREASSAIKLPSLSNSLR